MDRNTIVEYIAYLVDKDIDKEQLIVLFKDKNIDIDCVFFDKYILLRKLYNQILPMYNQRMSRFMSAVKKSVVRNRVENFPYSKIIGSFYYN